jgi:hypothetical protein
MQPAASLFGMICPVRCRQRPLAVPGPKLERRAPRLLTARTTLHWHAHAVGALSYSMDGASLLSGGQEGVLVRVLALRCGACSPQQ